MDFWLVGKESSTLIVSVEPGRGLVIPEGDLARPDEGVAQPDDAPAPVEP